MELLLCQWERCSSSTHTADVPLLLLPAPLLLVPWSKAGLLRGSPYLVVWFMFFLLGVELTKQFQK